MKNTAKGFTLIELLVIVLIIGILTSVALPQYQKAVAKTRIISGLPLARGLKTALDEYYLANGNFTAVYENLILDVPPNYTDKDGNAYSKVLAGTELYYNAGRAGQQMYKIQTGGVVQYQYLLPIGKTINIYFHSSYATADDGAYKGRIYCTGQNNASAATAYCLAIGGVKDGNKYFLN